MPFVPAWEKSLPEYLGLSPIKGSPADERLIAQAWAKTESACREDFMPIPYHWRNDIQVLVSARARPIGSILLLDPEDGSLLGGASLGLPFIRPDQRGRGLGAEIVCISDYGKSFALYPIRFSLEGFHARRSAHRIQVERALALDPCSVSPAALEWYQKGQDGRLSLCRAWGVEEQNGQRCRPDDAEMSLQPG